VRAGWFLGLGRRIVSRTANGVSRLVSQADPQEELTVVIVGVAPADGRSIPPTGFSLPDREVAVEVDQEPNGRAEHRPCLRDGRHRDRASRGDEAVGFASGVPHGSSACRVEELEPLPAPHQPPTSPPYAHVRGGSLKSGNGL